MKFSHIFNRDIGRDYIRHGIIYRILKFWGLRDFDFIYIRARSRSNSSIEVLCEYSYSDLDRAPLVSISQDVFASKNDVGRFAFSVSNGILDALAARVYTPDLTFIADSSAWSVPHAMRRWPAQINRIKQRRIPKIPGRVTFVPNQTYFHWLLEDLPSLLRILKMSPGIQVLVGAHTKSYILDCLNYLQVKYSVSPSYVQVEKLIYESRGPALVPQSVDVRELDEFADQFNRNPVGRKWLYVSRRDSGRIPRNEDAVEVLMKSFGVQIVSLAGKSMEEQISIFRDAEAVIGTHGAGLANIVWCLSGKAKVLEIRTRLQPQCYKLLCSQKNIEYSSVESNDESNWVVDLESLRIKLIGMRP